MGSQQKRLKKYVSLIKKKKEYKKKGNVPSLAATAGNK
jgi:hypothetical protein